MGQIQLTPWSSEVWRGQGCLLLLHQQLQVPTILAAQLVTTKDLEQTELEGVPALKLSWMLLAPRLSFSAIKGGFSQLPGRVHAFFLSQEDGEVAQFPHSLCCKVKEGLAVLGRCASGTEPVFPSPAAHKRLTHPCFQEIGPSLSPRQW